jgi:hypothetical protein
MEQQLRSVPNPERGCGQLKDKGFYARGDIGVNGLLKTWAWALGEMLIGGRNLTVSAPARGMQIINLPMTLAEGRIYQEKTDYKARFSGDPLVRVPAMAILDHVGSNHYTPSAFAAETAAFGPSRRIPRDIAKIIASHTPIPIVFTHSWMPVVDGNYLTPLMVWAGADEATREWYTYAPTFEGKSWGLYSGDQNGGTHWGRGVLQKLHEAGKGKEEFLFKLMPQELAENVLTVEQIFGISWITRCVYIADGTESDAELGDLWNDGIEPVRKDDE